MRHIMLDIETLGVTPGCVVLSIGAVEFNETTILEKYSVHIDPNDAANYKLHCDVSTVMWWMKQSKEAHNAILTARKLPLEDALTEFRNRFLWKDALVWCNGAAFDFPILTALFTKAGVPKPWEYYNEMDMRTVKNLAGKQLWKSLEVKPTVAHDGLEDAIAQAKSLQNYFAIRNQELPKNTK